MEPVQIFGESTRTVCVEQGGRGLTINDDMLSTFDSEEVVVVLWRGEDGCVNGRIYERNQYARRLERDAKSTSYKLELFRRRDGSIHFVIPEELWKDSMTSFYESFREKKHRVSGIQRLKPLEVKCVGLGDRFELWPWTEKAAAEAISV